MLDGEPKALHRARMILASSGLTRLFAYAFDATTAIVQVKPGIRQHAKDLQLGRDALLGVGLEVVDLDFGDDFRCLQIRVRTAPIIPFVFGEGIFQRLSEPPNQPVSEKPPAPAFHETLKFILQDVPTPASTPEIPDTMPVSFLDMDPRATRMLDGASLFEMVGMTMSQCRASPSLQVGVSGMKP